MELRASPSSALQPKADTIIARGLPQTCIADRAHWNCRREDYPMAQHHEDVELLKRQFFQLVNPDELTLPPKDLLRRPDIQAQIHECMFRTEGVRLPPPPKRYQSRVLKLLVREIEESIEDPNEDVREYAFRFSSDLLIGRLSACLLFRFHPSQSPLLLSSDL